jgi:hypothetical protein
VRQGPRQLIQDTQGQISSNRCCSSNSISRAEGQAGQQLQPVAAWRQVERKPSQAAFCTDCWFEQLRSGLRTGQHPTRATQSSSNGCTHGSQCGSSTIHLCLNFGFGAQGLLQFWVERSGDIAAAARGGQHQQHRVGDGHFCVSLQ